MRAVLRDGERAEREEDFGRPRPELRAEIAQDGQERRRDERAGIVHERQLDEEAHGRVRADRRDRTRSIEWSSANLPYGHERQDHAHR